MNRVGDFTGALLRYSLMLQVPAITQSFSGSTRPVAMAQAETSKRPPATGVPSRSPVCSAAARVTRPQSSPERWSLAGNLCAQPGEAEGRQQLGVVGQGVDVDQAGPGAVGDLAQRLPRQLEADVVLAGEDPAGPLQHLGVVVAEPGQERGGLGGPDRLAGPREHALEGAVLVVPLDVAGGARVGGDDAVPGRAAVLLDQVQAAAVAGGGDGRDLPRVDLGLPDDLPITWALAAQNSSRSRSMWPGWG